MAAAERRRVFFVSSWIAIVFLNAYIIAPSPVFPQLMEAMGVSNAAVGALVSLLLLAAILVQIPGAYLIDRIDNRRIVAIAIVGLNAVSLPALLLRYDLLLISRLISGLFIPLLFVSVANLVSQAFPEARVRALGAYLAAPPAGYALGTFATPFLAPLLGLPFIFLAYALPILVLLPAIHWAAGGIPRDRGPMLPLREYAAAFRSWELWRLGLAFAGTYALYILFTSWMPTFLQEDGGLSLAAAGGMAALVPALGILSRPVGGILADTTFRRDKRRVLLFSFAFVLPLSLVWTLPASLRWALLLLPLLGFTIQLPFSVYYAFSSQILPERLQGSAYTFMNTTSLIGGALAPYAAGLLRDVTGLFLPVFLFGAALAGVGLVLSATSRER